MRAKLSPEVAQALVGLSASKDWQIFKQWLEIQGANWNQVLIDANEPDKRAIAAGMVRAVNDIVLAIDTAPEILRGRNG